jgi:hypothetical protein
MGRWGLKSLIQRDSPNVLKGLKSLIQRIDGALQLHVTHARGRWELATRNIGTGIVVTMRWVDWPDRDYNRLPSDRQVATG